MNSATQLETRSCLYIKESQSLSLEDFADYYGHRLPQCALIDAIGIEDDHSVSNETLSQGDLVQVSVKKKVPTIHARVEGAEPALLCIPVVCMELKVALLPPNDCEAAIVNRRWERTFTSVSDILASRTLPPAVKVMGECCSYEKRRVKFGVILFNIEVIRVGLLRRRAIRGVCMYGTAYTFLDGTRVLFSSRQCDTQCSLWECAAIIRYPQQVTAFLDREEESKKFPRLKNLSELTLTGKKEKPFLLMYKMKEDGSTEDKPHTLPADSHTMVMAVKMGSSEMASRNASKEKQRPMPPLPPTPPPERYTRFEVHSSSVTRSLPCLDDEELYDEPDQLMHDMGLSNSASTLLPQQTLPTIEVDCEEDHATDPSSMRTTTSRLDLLDASGDNDSYVTLCPSPSLPSTKTGSQTEIGAEKSDSLLQDIETVRRMRCDTAPPHLSSPDPVRRNTTCSRPDLQRSTLAPPTGIQARPTERELFHHVACNLGDDWKHFAIYLGFESTQIQQADNEKTFKDKAYDILVAWRKGTGNKPKTWTTILTALESTGLTDLACEIQGDIDSGKLGVTCP